jgi:hypothetical protein
VVGFRRGVVVERVLGKVTAAGKKQIAPLVPFHYCFESGLGFTTRTTLKREGNVKELIQGGQSPVEQRGVGHFGPWQVWHFGSYSGFLAFFREADTQEVFKTFARPFVPKVKLVFRQLFSLTQNKFTKSKSTLKRMKMTKKDRRSSSKSNSSRTRSSTSSDAKSKACWREQKFEHYSEYLYCCQRL